MKRPFWRNSHAEDTKLSPRPENYLGYTKLAKVARNSIEFWNGFCAGDTKLSLGPDNDPRYTTWTKVARTYMEAGILEGFLCR